MPTFTTTEQVVDALSAGKLKPAEAKALLAKIDAEKLARRTQLSCKVSPKGALSVYGLQRMPVTLYVEQWERLLAFAEDIRTFIAASNGSLSRKADKKAA